MATANTSPKSARIETRVSREQKERIERAAACSGRTVSDFILVHIEVAAKKIIEDHRRSSKTMRSSILTKLKVGILSTRC
jgi:uncharacterized protein (DUF1778 family)